MTSPAKPVTGPAKTGPAVSCLACNVPLGNMQSMDEFLSHLEGKKHTARAWMIRRAEGLDDVVIYVGGYKGQDSAEIIKYFVNKFPAVVTVARFTNNDSSYYSMMVQFDKSSVVDAILKKGSHKINSNCSVSPRRRQKPKDPIKIRGKEGERPTAKSNVTHKEIVDALRAHARDPEMQLRQLVLTAQLTDEDLSERAGICSRLSQTVGREMCMCEVRPFGSSVNGLGFKGCDLDVFIQTMNDNYHNDAVLKVRHLANALRRLSESIISHVDAVVTARVPIVKFIHVATGISCDVSFKNALSVLNTVLLERVAMIGSNQEEGLGRIGRLMFGLRYWAKHQGFTGAGGRTGLFTNYSFTMLMVFYLQHKGILPPVKAFQDGMNPSEQEAAKERGDTDIEGWNSSFSLRVEEIVKDTITETNDEPAIQLMHGFFTFYAEFDFLRKVISPFVGRALDREEMLAARRDKGANIRSEMQIYFALVDRIDAETVIGPSPADAQLAALEMKEKRNKNKVRSCGRVRVKADPDDLPKLLNLQPSLVVQDPFEHNRNIVSCIGYPNMVVFQATCRAATETLANVIAGEAEADGGLVSVIELNPKDPLPTLQSMKIAKDAERKRKLREGLTATTPIKDEHKTKKSKKKGKKNPTPAKAEKTSIANILVPFHPMYSDALFLKEEGDSSADQFLRLVAKMLQLFLRESYAMDVTEIVEEKEEKEEKVATTNGVKLFNALSLEHDKEEEMECVVEDMEETTTDASPSVKRNHSPSSSSGGESSGTAATPTHKRKKQKVGSNFSLHLSASAYLAVFVGRVKAASEIKLRVRPRFVESAPWEQEFLITSHIINRIESTSTEKDATLQFSLHWVAPEPGVGSHGHVCVSVERQASKKNAFMPMILHVIDAFPALFEKSLMGIEIRQGLADWIKSEGKSVILSEEKK